MNLCPTVRLALAVALAAVFNPLHADPKIDLERITPVPADRPIPTQDFFRPLALRQPTINRAGTHIAALVTVGEDKHMLMVYGIANASVDTLGSRNDHDIYNVLWLTNTRVLFQISSRKMFGLGIMAADVGDLAHAFAIQQYCGSSLVSIPLKSPNHPLVWNRYEFETDRDTGVAVLDSDVRSGGIVDLTSADSSMGMLEKFAKVREQNQRCILDNYALPPGPGLTSGYLADSQGELAYAYTSHEGNLGLYRLQDRRWLPCPVDLEAIDILGGANTPGQLLVRGPSVGGKPQPLQLMDAATGKLGDVIIQDAIYDFNGWLYRNPANGEVLGAVFNRSGPRTYWFNEQYRALQKILDGMFPGQVAQIIGSDDQHRIFLVGTYSDRAPVSYHWVDLEQRKAGLFKNSAPWIDPARMRPMQILQFKTRDGHKLDAYLTLPAGASKEHPAPLVVLCHGGPWARDNWGFDSEAQFLAHHGYAVLQPNYRGSTGSVGRFPADDEYDFVKMHADVTDAVKTALRVEAIDRTRVGIMGGSFGGYLAVSGVAHEPDLYRCAVTIAGVFDWAMQVLSEKYDQYTTPYYGRLVKKLGDPKKDTAKYDAMSPIRFVQNIRVPVFVAGGKDDRIVELTQSRKLIAALDSRRIPYEKYFVSGEGHGMAYLKHEVELYDRILVFLEKHLKGAP
jgi:dienelactone hydrolase